MTTTYDCLPFPRRPRLEVEIRVLLPGCSKIKKLLPLCPIFPVKILTIKCRPLNFFPFCIFNYMFYLIHEDVKYSCGHRQRKSSEEECKKPR